MILSVRAALIDPVALRLPSGLGAAPTLPARQRAHGPLRDSLSDPKAALADCSACLSLLLLRSFSWPFVSLLPDRYVSGRSGRPRLHGAARIATGSLGPRKLSRELA